MHYRTFVVMRKGEKKSQDKDSFEGLCNLSANLVLRIGILALPLSSFVTWTSCLSSPSHNCSCLIGLFWR